jgi:hypothetical protein
VLRESSGKLEAVEKESTERPEAVEEESTVRLKGAAMPF